ncbi:hypothetical protein ACFL1V_07535 [Pseudomonadota bacterium]
MSTKSAFNKVKEPAVIFKESNLRKDLPEDFLHAYELWLDVEKKIESHYQDLKKSGAGAEEFVDVIDGFFEFTSVDALFKKSSWAWAPSGKVAPFNITDRLGQHFFGAMFTCEEHEWPMHNQCPYKPFLQLDLDKASETAGVCIGSGFLQLFETPAFEVFAGYFLRHIPRQYISAETMTPLPTFSQEQEKKIEETYVWDVEDIFGAKSICINLDGFDNKRFSMPYGLDCIDELSTALESYGKDLLQKAITNLEQISGILSNLQRDMGEKYFDMHLFGYVEPIQVNAWEMPDPILRIGGCRSLIKGWTNDSKFDIYGDGNGQIYLDILENGEVDYDFYGDR